jgi:hypothetical protein
MSRFEEMLRASIKAERLNDCVHLWVLTSTPHGADAMANPETSMFRCHKCGMTAAYVPGKGLPAFTTKTRR